MFGKGFENRRFLKYLQRRSPTAKDFQISLRSAFEEASRKIPAIVSTAGVLGGSPCVRGTRVPVYMILDAFEYYGTVKGALKSYPKLTKEQVRDAIRFAKLVTERPVDNKTESSY
ncbi:MAG TPA: DUF433 domain-containing protein [Terriglobia bacterium]|nr:DUF433 domain-containing protein [Terriglobia bacterium]